MIILPAIDLKDGNCVRLTKGDFATTEKVAEDAVETALKFEEAGATHLHMVDLDGALQGKPVNNSVIKDVVDNTCFFVEVGGGIRTREDIEYYLGIGVGRVILGSVAINNPDFTKEMIKEFGAQIAVGIDAKNGMASGGGWLDDSSVNFIDLARNMYEAGVKTIIYTDISKDGTLAGPNLEELDAINKAVGANIIASGGIADIDDIEKLSKINVHGAICGKSIYKGTLDLSDALKYQE